ncbi:MAG TPA: universal stress protein [Methylomirabilota bacterium]|jgi:nucleotide-binding universal stress UspA family protein
MAIKIVLAFNGSAESKDALRLAELLADALDAELVVGCAYPHQPLRARLGDGAYQQFLRGEAETAAAEARGLVAHREHASVQVLPSHSPARALHELAEAERAHLVVVGSTHRARPGSVLPGSTGLQLLHGTPCAVTVTPRDYRLREQPVLSRIGAAFDGSTESTDAVFTAATLARAAGATLAVERVVGFSEPPEDHLLAAYTADLEALAEQAHAELDAVVAAAGDGLAIISRVVQGLPTSELVRWSAELDLLVLGSRGYGPLRQILLGSTSAELINWAECPVLVVPRGVERVLDPAAAGHAADVESAAETKGA